MFMKYPKDQKHGLKIGLIKKKNILPYEEYLKNFYWLGFWLDNHFKIILKIILPYLLLILIFAFSLKNNEKENN